MKNRKQDGLALVVVLWMLTLLTVMASAYSAVMRTETLLTTHYVQSARAATAAEAGVWLAIQELGEPESEWRRRSDGTLHTLDFGESSIELRIQDEEGKIDLNVAQEELLRSLLESVRESDAEFDSIEVLEAILDWRDRDNLVRNHGAEDDEYERSGLDYGAKDGPFNSIDELRRVMGMSDSLYRRIAPAVTVYSGRPGINPVVAPAQVLRAMPGTNDEAVEDYLLTRQDGDPGANPAVMAGLDNRFLGGNSPGIMTITSVGRYRQGRATLEVVILLGGSSGTPYTVLAWREL